MDRAYRFELRAAERARDLSRMVEIEAACFPPRLAYERRDLYRFLRAKNAATLVAQDRETGRVAGFVIVSWRRGSKVGYVQTIDVDPSERGNGLGQMLLETAERVMAERGLTRSVLQVYLRNSSALQLYLKAGYTIRRVRPRYYHNAYLGARDAIELLKEVTPIAPTFLTAGIAVGGLGPMEAVSAAASVESRAVTAAAGEPVAQSRSVMPTAAAGQRA
jgi:ribosomal-protein-alanine N-acetyltransferase